MQHGTRRNKNRPDLTGLVFGRLTAKRIQPLQETTRVHWLCECSCGNTHVVRWQALVSGNTQSCGCLPKKNGKQTHGLSATPEYIAWKDMLRRCCNEKARSYPKYGGRGISVDSAWLTSFETFLADVGKRPTNKHSLERLDNNGNYEKSNCVWAPPSVQARNRHTNIWITIAGQTRILTDWCRLNGISTQLANTRTKKLGWSLEKAVTTPPDATYRHNFRHKSSEQVVAGNTGAS